MKTRNGFVSNSSSSSFIIYGVMLSKKEQEKLEKTLEQKYPEPNNEYAIEDAAEDLDLITHTPEYEVGPMCIGKEVVSTYNESIEEIKEISEKTKLDTCKKLGQLGIVKSPKFYICGTRGL